jgi:glycosyltransferase involved in cell wall biosynthesis
VQRSIAVLLKGYPRLSETFIAQELLALERAGHALRLYSMRRPTDGKLHPIHREIAAPVAYLPEYLHEEPSRVMTAYRRARQLPGYRSAWQAFAGDFRREPTRNRVRRFGQALVLAAELPSDVYHLYAHFIHTPASVARYASLLLGLPWSCSAHAKDIWTTADWDLSGKLGSADWTVTCTKRGCERLRLLSPSAGRLRLVYHGLDLDRFAVMPTRRPLRDGSDPSDPVRLLSVGRAVAKKGFEVLIAALTRLRHDLNWRWMHIGGGDGLWRLKEQVRRLGLSSRVDWAGSRAQEEVLAAYRAADLFVLPCRVAEDGDRDGLPNVLMEAQSQRLACLSTHVSSIPELIIEGKTGVLVEPDDPIALSQALECLVQDPALREQLGDAGERRVRAEFEHSACTRALLRQFGTEASVPAPTGAAEAIPALQG